MSAQPAASPPNIEITIVASACSASARTLSSAAAGPAPDEDDALRLGDGRVVRVVEDPGAVAAGRFDPEIHDRRTLDHRDVAEHDDDVGVADRGEREPVGVERAGDLLRQRRLMGLEPYPEQLAER